MAEQLDNPEKTSNYEYEVGLFKFYVVCTIIRRKNEKSG